jgi:photosystem II stability/assembly factor-like uncharacterized protein
MNRRFRLSALTAAAVALTVTLTACSSDDGGDASADTSAGTAISHIHGVEINPADKKLYVATHNGIYTPDGEGRPQLVGDRKDDFMGFTIAADGSFLASGHPAPGRDAPANLGLIRSTDTGRTWKDESLSGEVDFHSLDEAHGSVYGYDSTNGLLRVSGDGVSWEKRSELAVLDIAVSPEDPEVVLATGEKGVLRSSDGGRTFGGGRKPLMAFLSWSTAAALYGIDPEGGLHLSADGGESWRKAGTVPGGRPQALTAVDARRLVAATQDGVYESADGGATFTRRMEVTSGGGH